MKRLVLVLAVLLALGGASAHAGSTPGTNGRIVFVRNDASSHAQIWVADADGGNAEPVTSDATNHYEPKWSPDATAIAYSAYPNPADATRADIYVLTISTGTVTDLTASLGGLNSNPAWSADGTKIAFDHSSEVWVMNADGSNAAQLTHDFVSPSFKADGQATWSPDGSEIAYDHQVSGGNYDIVAIKTDGSGTTRTVVGTGDFEGAPAWSPDGTTIAYAHATSASSSDWNIYTVPAAGGTPTAITNDASAANFSPQWSPDSTKIIWSANNDVEVVAKTGGTPTTVATGNGTNANPDWGVAAVPTALTVTSTAEGAGTCPSASACTLRQAVSDIAAGGTITVPAGIYQLSSQLLLLKNLTIAGAGASSTTIEQTATQRVIEVGHNPTGVTVTISGVTITGGNTVQTGPEFNPGVGGGVWIDSGSTLTLSQDVVTQNRAQVSGGGVDNDGTTTIARTSVTSNTAAGASFEIGGGIDNFGTLSIANTTIDGNTAGQHGGGLYTGGTASLTNVTVSNNSDQGVSGTGATTLVNTLLESNGAANCGDPVTSQGHNLSTDASCTAFTASGDRQSAQAAAGVDAGDDASCPAVDEDGTARPQGPHCDIGALETTVASSGGGGAGATASFAATTSGLGVSVDGSGSTGATSYTWSFGDGATASGATASHTYMTGGSYTITLTVSGNGATSAASQTVMVSAPQPPAPSVGLTASPAAAATHAVVTMTATVEDGSGAAAVSFDWTFGDGATLTTTGPTVVHRWAQVGNYTVVVTVTDANGRSGSASTRVAVSPPPPHIALNVQPAPGAAAVPTAAKQTRFYLTIPPGQADAASVSWSFGDGTTATGTTKTADHIYADAGTYTATVTETDNSGVTLSASKTFVVAPVQIGQPDPAHSSITASAPSVLTHASVTVTVELRDAWGRPVPGVAATIKPTPAQIAHTTPLSGTTNNQGKFTTTFHSDSDEDVLFSTTNVPGQAVTVTWGAAARSASIVMTPSSAPADGKTAVSATVALAAGPGQPARNKLVQLELRDVSANGVGAALLSETIATDATGHATFALTSDTAGAYVITIADLTDGRQFQHGTVSFTAAPGGPADPSTSTIAVDTQLVAVGGTAKATVTVALRNAHGGVVPSEILSLRGGDSNVIVSAASATTDANGVATFTVASKTPLTTTFTAIDMRDGVVVGPSPTVQFYAHVPDAATSSLTVSPATLAPGATSTVTVTVRDAGGAPMGGQSVSLVASDLTAHVHASKPATAANGALTFLVSTSKSETLHVRAITAGVTFGDTDIKFTTAVASAAASSVTVSKTLVDAGSGSAVVTVHVVAASGAPLNADQVDLRPGGGSSHVVRLSSNGLQPNGSRFGVSDLQAEQITYTAVDMTQGVTLGSVTVTFSRPVSASRSSIAAVPASAPADGTATIPITVTVRDIDGNPAVGRSVGLDVVSSSPFAAAGLGARTTDANGTVTFQLRSTRAESAIVQAAVDGVEIRATPALHITFSAAVGGTPSATLSTVSAPAASPTGSGGATVTVQLRNAAGGAVPGRSIQLTTRASAAAIRAVSATTNASGIATFRVSDAKPQSVRLVVKDTTDALALAQSPSIGFYVPGVDEAASSTDALVEQGTADGVTALTVTATARDAGGYPLSGRKLVLRVSGAAAVAPTSTVTATNGATSFKVTDATAETVTAVGVDEATGRALGKPVTLTFQPGVSGALSTVTSDMTNAASNGKSFVVVTVTLRDVTGAALPIRNRDIELDPIGTQSGSTVAITRNVSAKLTQAMFFVSDGRSETVTLSARDVTDGIPFAQTVAIAFEPPAVQSQSSIEVTPTTTAAGSTSSVTITAVLRRADGTPAAGKTVQLVTSNGVGGTAVTDATGAAILTLKSLHPRTVAIYVKDLSDSYVSPKGSVDVRTPSATVTFT